MFPIPSVDFCPFPRKYFTPHPVVNATVRLPPPPKSPPFLGNYFLRFPTFPSWFLPPPFVSSPPNSTPLERSPSWFFLLLRYLRMRSSQVALRFLRPKCLPSDSLRPAFFSSLSILPIPNDLSSSLPETIFLSLSALPGVSFLRDFFFWVGGLSTGNQRAVFRVYRRGTC